jgi:indolepyruvate ferredoxin oxidoreductase beta subunit
MNKNAYDIYIVGVGGQGVLTIGELITEAAFKKGLPANFYPTKGMAQRGGFVKAQLRLGRKEVGPSIPMQGADLVVSMELSETLKAIRFAKEGADFLIYGSVWAPTAVMLKKAPYPTVEEVWKEVEKVQGKVSYLDPANLPEYQGRPVRENIFVLGATLAQTGLKEIISEEEMITAITERWPKGAEENIFAFKAGFSAGVCRVKPEV